MAQAHLGPRMQQRIDASDLVQQTLLDAHAKRDQFRGETDAERAAWLRQILSRNLADALRHEHRAKRDVSRQQSLEAGIDFEEEFHRSMSIPVIKDDLLYTADFSGLFHCLNAKTGEVYWTYDMLDQCWGSPLLVDGKVYIGDGDGDIVVFRHTQDPRVAMELADSDVEPVRYVPVHRQRHYDIINEFNIGSSIYMTPIVANNVLYVATRNSLFAIQDTGESRPAVTEEN